MMKSGKFPLLSFLSFLTFNSREASPTSSKKGWGKRPLFSLKIFLLSLKFFRGIVLLLLLLLFLLRFLFLLFLLFLLLLLLFPLPWLFSPPLQRESPPKKNVYWQE
jgi:hypothetical protein